MHEVVGPPHQGHPEDVGQVLAVHRAKLLRIEAVPCCVFEDVHVGRLPVVGVQVGALQHRSHDPGVTEDVEQHPEVDLFVLPDLVEVPVLVVDHLDDLLQALPAHLVLGAQEGPEDVPLLGLRHPVGHGEGGEEEVGLGLGEAEQKIVFGGIFPHQEVGVFGHDGSVNIGSHRGAVELALDGDIHQSVDIDVPQTLGELGSDGALGVSRHLLHHVPRVSHNGRVGQTGAAAEDGPVEEFPVSLRDGREEQQTGEGGPCPLTQQSHAVRVSAKLSNVLLTTEILLAGKS